MYDSAVVDSAATVPTQENDVCNSKALVLPSAVPAASAPQRGAVLAVSGALLEAVLA